MKPLLIVIVLCAISFTATANVRNIAGFVYNTETGDGLHGVHVFWKGAPNLGTITNEDGNFLILPHADSDTLIVSHLGFETVRHHVARRARQLRIGISPRVYELSEVTVEAISADEIMRRVISRLAVNHPAHPVFYSFYHREVFFSRDSIIHFMEEHTGLIEHRRATFGIFNNNVRIDKSRMGYFTDVGEEMFENHRFISFTQILWDNPLFDAYDHLHRRRSRHFNFRFAGMETVNERNSYIIDFKTARSTFYPTGRLYIDSETFAIVKEELRNKTGSEVRQVNFIESNGQWFLRSVFHLRPRFKVEYGHTIVGYSHRTTIYNFIQGAAPVSGLVRIGGLMPRSVKAMASDFSDEYWEGFQSVLLPDWIESRIAGNNPRQ
ncbi:MAG TPA: hypothetical protein DCM62_09750 [Bacteroidales bacterium]|nr:hypothetical protein [Bacteroidales bacterium]